MWMTFKCLPRTSFGFLLRVINQSNSFRYIDFFLNAVATAENVAYLYFMAAKIKMAKDANVDDSTVSSFSIDSFFEKSKIHTYGKNLYMLSELAQYVIQDFCAGHGWTLSSYQGNPKLSRDLFTMDREKGQETNSRIFLPDEWLRLRASHGKSHHQQIHPVTKMQALVEIKSNTSVISADEEREKGVSPETKKSKVKVEKTSKKRAATDEEDGEPAPQRWASLKV
jgi:sister-chromatid-cohesion protein PDS5